ncbi:Uma2 family endonuclease [soil metagenome]
MGMALTTPIYTVEDLESFPEDGNRYELLEGMLLVTPAPSQLHQLIATRLSAALIAALGPDRARVAAPGVIVRPTRTQLEPDILAYPPHWPIRSRWVEVTEHWLAVEVFSPSSRIYDRDYKRRAYLEIGVREVWLVDLDDETVEVSRVNGSGEVVRTVVEWAVPDGGAVVSVDVREMFRR